jgi:8-oxo-dGTP pyrophosphatase MutT (NUDIX family)
MTVDVLPRLRAVLTAAALRPPDPVRTPAAVLVPLFLRDQTLHVLYITRSDTLQHHPGQVAFPGGRHLASRDTSLLATALRESEEEIGLAPAHVDVLGALDPIHTLTSNFAITPFVAVIPHPYPFRLNPDEVREVFSIPLTVLDDPRTAAEERWVLGGHPVPVATYRHEGRVIWGATQRITAMLVDLLTALRVG